MKADVLASISAPRTARLDGRGATRAEEIDRAAWFKRGTGSANGSVRWSPASKSTFAARTLEWSDAELAMACRGLDQRLFNVLLYELARNDAVLMDVHRHLLEWATREAAIAKWRATIRTVEGQQVAYLPDLCTILLLERRAPWRFEREPGSTKAIQQRVLLNCSNDTWRRHVAAIYERLYLAYEVWLDVALEHANRRLRS